MSTGFRARVLVAEDEEFTLNLLREVLEGELERIGGQTVLSFTMDTSEKVKRK